jgi:hypothetical protein
MEFEEKSTGVSSSGSSNYSVGEMYKKSWNTVKKHLGPLATITLIGVVINVAISAVATFAIVNNIFDDISSAIVSGLVGGIVSILAGVFVSLLQVISLKRLSEGQKINPGEVISESLQYLPRALSYGAFIIGIFIVATGVIAVLTAAAGPLGALAGIAFAVGLVIAVFRYAFLQFLIVEKKEMAFMERFKLSQKLTNGIYGTLFMMWLMAIVLSIGGAIIGGIISAPFNSKVQTKPSDIKYDFSNAQSVEDFRKEVNKTVKSSSKAEFDAKYILRQLIAQAISWGIGLVVLGALLELYNKRKSGLHF